MESTDGHETTTHAIDPEHACGDVTDAESLSDCGGVALGGGESGSDNEFDNDVEIDGQTYQSDLEGKSDASGLDELDNDSDTAGLENGLENGSDVEEIDESDILEEVDDVCTEESDDESECDDDK